MIQEPYYSYCGLTIILNKPSRFDKQSLISGYAGDYFSSCLRPVDRFQCQVRTADESKPYLPGTRTVLLLGQEALDLIKPGVNLHRYRGSPILVNDKVYLPTLAPQDAYDRQNYENKEDDESEDDPDAEKDYQRTRRVNFRFWLKKDVKKAVRIHKQGIRTYPRMNTLMYPDLPLDLLFTTKDKILVLDIETTRERKITVLSFTLYDPSNPDNIDIFCIPVQRYTNTIAYPEARFARFFAALATAFQNNLVVGHNISFDLFVLCAYYHVPFPRRIFDTMIAQHRCYPESEKSLGHCISLYTDLPYHKDEGIFEPRSAAQESTLWTYNAKDVYTTLLVYLEIQNEIDVLKARESVDQAMRSIRPMLTMTYEGARIDIPALERTFDSYSRRSEQMQRLLKLATGFPINPRSPKQVAAYLFDHLKLPRPDENPTKEENLIKLYIKYGLPSIRILIEARGASKLASALKFRLWREDRLTCSWKIAGTETFRLASSALFKFRSDKGYGTNFQNWKKSIRHIVAADPGMILGQNDQAGAEALIVAYLCMNARFRQLFLNKIKPHTYVAMHLVPEYWAEHLGVPDIQDYLNAPIPELRGMKYWKDLEHLIKSSDENPDGSKRYYYIGKQACHSLNYDATWMMFQLNSLVKSEGSLRITDQEAKRIHSLYRDKLFPEITFFHQDVQNELEQNGRVLRNLFGHPRFFNAMWGRDLFKKAYAFKPQSTVGSITNIAITELQERLDANDPLLTEARFSILENGHDSILWQCKEEFGPKVAIEVKRHLERTLTTHRGETFKMGSECALGYNWGSKSDKNPSGLEEIKL